MRVVRTRSSQAKAGGHSDLDSGSGYESESMLRPHNAKAVASQDSERWQLLKKINEVIKVTGNSAESTHWQGQSTGLNRHNRWTSAEKVAAGSSIYATTGHTTSGNVANAQATARRSAQNVCASIFVPYCWRAHETFYGYRSSNSGQMCSHRSRTQSPSHLRRLVFSFRLQMEASASLSSTTSL